MKSEGDLASQVRGEPRPDFEKLVLRKKTESGKESLDQQ